MDFFHQIQDEQVNSIGSLEPLDSVVYFIDDINKQTKTSYLQR
jgi:hypothetical protein